MCGVICYQSGFIIGADDARPTLYTQISALLSPLVIAVFFRNIACSTRFMFVYGYRCVVRDARQPTDLFRFEKRTSPEPNRIRNVWRKWMSVILLQINKPHKKRDGSSHHRTLHFLLLPNENKVQNLKVISSKIAKMNKSEGKKRMVVGIICSKLIWWWRIANSCTCKTLIISSVVCERAGAAIKFRCISLHASPWPIYATSWPMTSNKGFRRSLKGLCL